MWTKKETIVEMVEYEIFEKTKSIGKVPAWYGKSLFSQRRFTNYGYCVDRSKSIEFLKGFIKYLCIHASFDDFAFY